MGLLTAPAHLSTLRSIHTGLVHAAPTKAVPVKRKDITEPGVYLSTLTAVEQRTSRSQQEMVAFVWDTDQGPITTYLSLAADYPLQVGIATWELILDRIGLGSKRMRRAKTLYDKAIALVEGLRSGILGKGYKLSIEITLSKVEGSNYVRPTLVASTATLEGRTPKASEHVEAPQPVHEASPEPTPDSEPVHEPVSLSWSSDPVVIDWSYLCKWQSYSLLSGHAPCTRPTETQEIGYRVLLEMAKIRARYPGRELVIVTDSAPYWRSAVLPGYKAHRASKPWPFATPKEEMRQCYQDLLPIAAAAVGSTVLSAPGLEADDLWAMVVAHHPGEVLGLTGDSDWAQLVDEQVSVINPATGESLGPLDIRIKLIGGDASDNVPGLTKRKKDGTPSTRKWGPDGAKSLIEDPSWADQLDPEELARNYHLLVLPPPEPITSRAKVSASTFTQSDCHWATFGLTPSTLARLRATERQ